MPKGYYTKTGKPFKPNRPPTIPQRSAKSQAWSKIRYSARVRGIQFELTREQWEELSKLGCTYCGSPPSNISKPLYGTGDFHYNGIDRVDNTLGYSYKNCVSCCFLCNSMKSTRNMDKFLEAVKKIYEYTFR